MITVNQARKILGRSADFISDETLEQELQTANLLKELFFDMHIASRKSESLKRDVVKLKHRAYNDHDDQ